MNQCVVIHGKQQLGSDIGEKVPSTLFNHFFYWGERGNGPALQAPAHHFPALTSFWAPIRCSLTQDNMKALEQQMSEAQQVKNLGGDAPMFVSGGTVGNAQEGSVANKEEIDIGGDTSSVNDLLQIFSFNSAMPVDVYEEDCMCVNCTSVCYTCVLETSTRMTAQMRQGYLRVYSVNRFSLQIKVQFFSMM